MEFKGIQHPEMLKRILADHIKKPAYNTWSEENWVAWFYELKTIVKDDPNISKYLNKTVTKPEYVQWSRWVLWHKELIHKVGDKEDNQ